MTPDEDRSAQRPVPRAGSVDDGGIGKLAGWVRTVLVWLVLIGAAVVLRPHVGSWAGRLSAYFDLDSYQSYGACQEFVLRHLNTPSTARFAGRLDGATAIHSYEGRPGTDYAIKSFVDAENQFGAKVRLHFHCTAKWNAGWSEASVVLAPWVASTADEWMKQSEVAFRSADYKWLREIGRDWLSMEPFSPYALIASGAGSYADDDSESAVTTLGRALNSPGLLPRWRWTASALYGAALYKAKRPDAEQREAATALLLLDTLSLFNGLDEREYEQWAQRQRWIGLKKN